MTVLPLRFRLARRVDILNVKDFGAKGDGVTNDGAAIQAALDSAYGPLAALHTNPINNKGVFFPAGIYLVDQQLFLNNTNSSMGAWLFGAGQRATRLLYTGPQSNLPSGDITSLLTCRTMTYSRIEGITFDVTGSNATCAVQLMNFPSIANDGTGNTWFDCGFVGAADDGFLCSLDGSGATGSEELFIGCLFDSCTYGATISTDNALDYSFIGCRFQNCSRGIFVPAGAVNLIKGCSFNNPGYASFSATIVGTNLTVTSAITGAIAKGQTLLGTGDLNARIVSGSGTNWIVSPTQNIPSPRAFTSSGLDIYVKENQSPAIIGCRSTSTHFCIGGPIWIAGCYHNPANPGYLWLGGIDGNYGVIEGCLAGSNSGLFSGTSGGGSDVLYLRGNTFNNAGYLSTFTTISFTGSISGTALTTTGGPHLLAGLYITGSGVTPGTRIVSGSGDSWVVTPSQTVASTTMTTTTGENI